MSPETEAAATDVQDAASSPAVVGREENVVPFRAAGFAVRAADTGPAAAAAVRELLGSGCRVIFYTDDLAPHLADLLEQTSSSPVSCLVALPSRGSRYGLERLKATVRRAVGADVRMHDA
jgi:vacuolar-type H+-ATPase subunit F/Vma7